VVRAVDDPGSPAAAELAREGLLPGSTIVVASRTPLGGPTVIALGRARLAVSADIASLMMTEPCPPDGSDDPSRPGESGLGAR
jgi:Fe2+ transport system protein FeoA